jgi:hypothetical protein
MNVEENRTLKTLASLKKKLKLSNNHWFFFIKKYTHQNNINKNIKMKTLNSSG